MALTDHRASIPISASHVAVAAHLFAVITIILILVWTIHFRGGANLNSDNPDLIFNVHPLVMFLGFIFVAGEGIMAYKTVRAPRNIQKMVHMGLQLVAVSLGILGVYSAFKFHKESEIPDMYTLHSWLGILTICLFGLQWLFGFVCFWYPKAALTTRQMVAPWHRAFGLGVFLLAICTAETGLVGKQVEPGAETRVINFTGLFILLFGIAVTLCPLTMH